MKDNVLLGAHMSIAGGVDKAILRGEKLGCTTIQIFTKNNNQWKSKPFSENEIEKFILLSRGSNINPIFAHTSYLINLASHNNPGSTLGKDVKTGINMISDALNKIFSEKKESMPMICLETTAGQGYNIGYRFEHIAEIIEKTPEENRLGVCLDTCHIFAAGYDIRDEKSYNKTFREFDTIIGIKRLKIIHINDSKRELGSRVDRHEHIGRGLIGIKAFDLIMNDRKLKNIPKILETPKGKDMKEDTINMKILLNLLR